MKRLIPKSPRELGEYARNTVDDIASFVAPWGFGEQRAIRRAEHIEKAMLQSPEFNKLSSPCEQGEKLFEHLKSKLRKKFLAKCPWKLRLRVQESTELNAFALPGGTVAITSSLYRFCDWSELAAVMAHEIGHIVRWHSSKGRLESIGETFVLSKVPAAHAIIQLVKAISQSGFSQELEHEADRFSAQLTWAAGFAPNVAVKMLSRLHQVAPAQGDSCTLLSSHPPLESRIDEIKRFIDEAELTVGKSC